jgi:hypothetical protein
MTQVLRGKLELHKHTYLRNIEIWQQGICTEEETLVCGDHVREGAVLRYAERHCLIEEALVVTHGYSSAEQSQGI